MTAVGRPWLGLVIAPIRRFLNLEAASAFVLLAAAILALAWANSPFGWLYRRLFEQPFTVWWAGRPFPVDLRAIVSDGLMTFFFFLAGMEIKREAVEGDLRSLRRALLPAVAALGGMIVPALTFRLLAAGSRAAHGWGIPMATDLAFCLGALKLLGPCVPRSLLVFVTALAIFDDVGGVLVIAFFYGHQLRPLALLAAAAVATALILAGRSRRWHGFVFALGGALLWGALKWGGVHPTIAGVITGLAIPAGPRAASAARVASPADRLIARWHPWVAFLVMPLFALASSGVRLTGAGQLPVGRVTVAAALGLFAGKQAGIFGATFAAVKLGLARMPAAASWSALYGVSLVAGIGFTVALFMADLAYAEAGALLQQARLGIMLGSLASAVTGLMVLRASARWRCDPPLSLADGEQTPAEQAAQQGQDQDR